MQLLRESRPKFAAVSWEIWLLSNTPCFQKVGLKDLAFDHPAIAGAFVWGTQANHSTEFFSPKFTRKLRNTSEDKFFLYKRPTFLWLCGTLVIQIQKLVRLQSFPRKLSIWLCFSKPGSPSQVFRTLQNQPIRTSSSWMTRAATLQSGQVVNHPKDVELQALAAGHPGKRKAKFAALVLQTSGDSFNFWSC